MSYCSSSELLGVPNIFIKEKHSCLGSSAGAAFSKLWPAGQIDSSPLGKKIRMKIGSNILDYTYKNCEKEEIKIG